MIEDQKFAVETARKSWVSPAIIEGSLENDTQNATGAGTDGLNPS